jgi:HEAT repeat protein
MAESLRALGDTVPQELVELAADPSLRSSLRARALHALGWFPSTETRTVLETALQGDDKLMARKAAYALANGWSSEAIPALGRALSSADPQLRNAAARALGNIEDKSVVSILDARLSVEDQPSVREAIESSLSRRR